MTPCTPFRSDRAPAASGPPAWLPAWLVAGLLAALLLAPWLGAVHAVLHGAPVPSAAVARAGTEAVRDQGLLRLFGGHTHDGDCRLYDQLAHADGLQSVAALPPLLLPPVATLAWHAGECLRRWAALFDARGPPALA